MVDLPIEIHEAGLLLVVRTLPGSAHAIAAALDRARWPEVAGSIAGDDTLFVAFPDRGSLQRIKRRLVRLTEGATRRLSALRRRVRTARALTRPRPADYHSHPVGTSGARLGRETPGVLSFIDDRPARSAHIRPPASRGPNDREQQAHLSLQGRSREAPLGAGRDGLGQAARGRQPDPRRQGARRPVRERRVRGRQERAGVRRGPDPDPRGAHQERHDHRREPLDRPRPDRLHRRGREPATARKRSPSSARPRPSRPRAGSPTRARSGARCWARRRARRSSSRCRPATSPTRSSGSPKVPRRSHGLGGRARGPGQRPAGRQRLEDTLGDGPRRQPPRPGHPRRHRSCPARQRASRRRCCTASTTWTRWTPRRS